MLVDLAVDDVVAILLDRKGRWGSSVKLLSTDECRNLIE